MPGVRLSNVLPAYLEATHCAAPLDAHTTILYLTSLTSWAAYLWSNLQTLCANFFGWWLVTCSAHRDLLIMRIHCNADELTIVSLAS